MSKYKPRLNTVDKSIIVIGDENSDLVNTLREHNEKFIICDSADKFYDIFKRIIKRRSKEIRFDIVGGTTKNSYLFSIQGKSSGDVNQLYTLKDILKYYFVNRSPEQDVR